MNTSHNSGAQILRRVPGMLSGPDALSVLIFLSRLSTPFLETVMLLSVLEFLSSFGGV